ncbi:sulfatase [Halococcus saccharolyticus DSM 5350]|uniref:Sulfatase n=2 Tax=Halococcus saccharolyticus TaxID=62319 RepID=M0MNP9_9EURY|nr:sulfatase [Halococcus saccharolyticus DSM 5350]
MDALANDAALATDATAPSSHTRASVPALLTSQYSHRYFANFFHDIEAPTLSTYLSEAGYNTAAFHSNPLISRHFGYDEGFDEFYDGLRFVESTQLPETVTSMYSKLLRLLSRFPYEPAESVTKRARKWLSEAQEPFFLWVHYMDPHGPYALNRQLGYLDKYRSERLWQKAVTSPDEVSDAERDRLRAAYRDEVGHTDKYLGKLIEAVDGMNETILALTGDHGEEFYEHGQYSHPAELYETTTNVPLIVDVPGSDGTDTPTTPLSGLDIVPTILDALDIEPRTGLAGESLIPTLSGRRLDREQVIAETNRGQTAVFGVRTQRWKYIVAEEGKELYDLSVDPGEQNDLSGTEPAIESRLEEHLASHVDSHDVEGGDKLATVAEEMDTEVRDRLNDLGYL